MDETVLDRQARVQQALDLAYRYLGRRDRTAAEARRHLATRGVEDEAVVDEVVGDLVRQGYIDDARYARLYAEDRRSLDGWGSERIEQRLLAAGIEREHVQAAIQTRAGAGELEAAIEVLRRRLREIPATERQRERALGILVRKGYDLELAYEAVRAFSRTD